MNNTVVVEHMLDEMGKPVPVKRKIVRIASDEHEAGWRYGYEDTMVEGEHSLYEGEVEPEKEVPFVADPVAKQQARGKKKLEGWGENS